MLWGIQTMDGQGLGNGLYVEQLRRDTCLLRVVPVSQERVLKFVAKHDLGRPRSY